MAGDVGGRDIEFRLPATDMRDWAPNFDESAAIIVGLGRNRSTLLSTFGSQK